MKTVVIPVDATSFKATKCDMLYKLTVIDGLIDIIPDKILATGSAVHKYAELRAMGFDDTIAMLQATAIPGLDMDKTVGAITTYQSAYHSRVAKSGGVPLVEVKFDILYEEFDHLDTHYEVRLQGKIDRIDRDGSWVDLIDYKTARKPRFIDVEAMYTYGIQFDFYYYIARKYCRLLFPEEICIAIEKGNLAVRLCAVMLSHDPVNWEHGQRRFMNICQFNAFGDHLRRRVDEIKELWIDPSRANHSGYFADLCPGCKFKELCHAQDEHALRSAASAFAKKPYEPLKW